ncbi:MAG: response regulator [Acidobacteriota bacterium]|nr:response regulator [Acidobacteriota bacterium]
MASKPQLVLCVDDELVGLQVRRILLERAGYQVLTASSGPEGLTLFAANPVDVVVLDYAMPGMDGGVVAAEMRRRRPDVPILLLTAYVSLPAEVSARIDTIMTKGEGAPLLLERLQQLLSRRTAS